ncbi:MAG: segregation/condensation protein A [Candidatus Moranbacteria bacterium]|jgi:segregation and condensation protein A|nr:segregation/condensation protein A [Candidatus Moranbacteria bacterium]
MPCHIKLAQFEGPLELLLSLIEDRKLDITKVSLGSVADQYLERLAADKDAISLENLSSFLVIAARLILIKSKMLLPVLEFTDEEEEAMEDLEIRLIEYRRFREAAQEMERVLDPKRRSFPREKFLRAMDVFIPPKGVTPESLRKHFESVLGEIPVHEKIIEETVEEIMSLEERIADLQASLRDRAEYSFHELSRSAADRMEVIVSFLAVLELVKQRYVVVDQRDAWGDIRISVSETIRTQAF